MRRWIRGVAMAVSICGCDSDDIEHSSMRSPNGVPIVSNDDDSAGRDVWRLAAQPTLTIGSELGTDTASLFSIAVGAVRLDDGRIAVFNAGSASIRIYDSTGRHLRSMGRRGQGPGEFQAMYGLRRGRGDDLVVIADRGVSTVFTPDGRVTVRRLEGGWRNVIGTFADGRMVLSGPGTTRPGLGGLDTVLSNLALFSRDAQFLDSLGPHVTGLRLRNPAAGRSFQLGSGNVVVSSAELPIRFGGSGLLVVGETGYYWGFSSTYEIHQFTPTGDLIRIIRRPWKPVPITEQAREEYWTRRFARRTGDGLQVLHQLAAESRFAEHFPAYRALRVDRTGWLWVQDHPTRMAELTAQILDHVDWNSRWSVFDPSGRWRATIELPGGLSIFEIGADYILGRTVSELGVERVVLYPLIRSSR